MERIDYVAIDFETANANPTSACSIGIVGANNGKVVFEKYYLINPHEYFLPQNIDIHGITPDDVKDAMSFPEVWEEIYDLLDGQIVFAHYAEFDMGVLKSLLDKYHLKYPCFLIGCTLKVARIAFKGVLSHFNLGIISSYLEVEHNHHNAISDAMICYYMLERVKRMYQVYDVKNLFEEIGLSFGVLSISQYRTCQMRIKKTIKQISSKKLEGLIIAFTGKPLRTTKNEFKNLIERNGGLYSREISRVINAFVIFTNPTKAHLQKLELLRLSKEVKIYTEEEIMRLING